MQCFIDQNGKIKSVSQKMYLLTEETFNPDLLIERNNLVYLHDKNKGVLCFDFMGTYKFWYKNIQGDKIEIVNQQIIYLQNKQLFFSTKHCQVLQITGITAHFIAEFRGF